MPTYGTSRPKITYKAESQFSFPVMSSKPMVAISRAEKPRDNSLFGEAVTLLGFMMMGYLITFFGLSAVIYLLETWK